MLEVLEDVLSSDAQNSFLAAPVDAHVLLEIDLLRSKAHQTTVALIHFKEVLGK